MITVGLNKALTTDGKLLKDGAVSIIHDGEVIFASAEERFSRKKHDGGYLRSLEGALKWLGLSIDDIDYFGISSCIETLDNNPKFYFNGNNINPEKVIGVPHHLSHAYSTFFPSNFDKALIVVMDAGGNILTDESKSNWWENRREQVTYYLGEGTNIKYIDSDFDLASEVGFGEMYRAFTHYLGWPSYTLSANTMALSGYGKDKDNPFNTFSIFEYKNGSLSSPFINDPHNPAAMILEAAKKQGVKLPIPLDPYTISDSGEYYGQYSDLAKHLQNELERALIKKISFLIEKYHIDNLCIAGGVGLNCVANKKILDNTKLKSIFIQPAAGDDGQALGNAYYTYLSKNSNFKKSNKIFSPYLGRNFDLSYKAINKYKLQNNSPVRITQSQNIYKIVAQLIHEGKIIGWYQGRSEYGPRALGNRSILASPSIKDNFKKCHSIKTHKELYRPFAPSILRERVSKYFKSDIDSPYMTLVSNVRDEMWNLIPAVVHIDGSARLQTVTEESNSEFYNLLKEYEKITGIPILLNTSFNKRNEPIVDTPEDAIKCFLETEIDVLVLGNLIVEKENSDQPIPMKTKITSKQLQKI